MKFVVQLWSSKKDNWIVSAYTDYMEDATSSEEACLILLEAPPMMASKYRILQLEDDDYYIDNMNYPVVAEYTREQFIYYQIHGSLRNNFEVET